MVLPIENLRFFIISTFFFEKSNFESGICLIIIESLELDNNFPL